MDVPLQLACASLDFAASSLRFNPCFNGCSSATLDILLYLQIFMLVSILVLMDVPLQRTFAIASVF